MTQGAFSILLVCTANICRSPAGQSVLTAQLAGHRARVESAGTRALDGNTMDPIMTGLLEQRGFDAMAAHRSRPIMPVMLGRYDLILCMQDEHLRQTLTLYPTGRGKVRLLGHWSTQQIADPTGQSDDDYLSAFDQIEACAGQWARKLIDMGMMR